jgi:hypothetical protein
MKRKLILPSLLLAFALLACSISINPTNPPVQPAVTVVTVVAPPAVITNTPVVPVLPPPVGPMDVLKNGTYNLPGCDGGLHSYTLTNGSYVSGPDSSAINYTAVYVGDMMAFGDLNNDGVGDAAVIAGLNCGGTGVFTYFVAMLSSGGTYVSAAVTFIDDRPNVTSLNIVDGAIVADVVVHGAADPMCCPTLQETQSYRLVGSALWLTRLTMPTGGTIRAIDVTSPANWAGVSNPFTVSGSVTISPFENTLGYWIYLPDGTKVNEGSLIVSSAGMGTPGTFSQTFDLSMAGITGPVIIQFVDLSAADGSILSLGAVVVNVY